MSKNKLLVILIIYSFTNIFFTSHYFNIYFNYFQITFWLIFLFNNCSPLIQNNKTKKEVKITLIISLFFIFLYFLSGFILGFSKSPYNHSFIQMFKNILENIIPILGIEIMRYKLINNNRHNKKLIIFITILIFLAELNIKSIFVFNKTQLFHNVVSILIPLLFRHSLFTYLSLNTNYYLPLVIRIIDQIIILTLPIIPYNNWYIKGSLEITNVMIIYFLFKYFVFPKRKIKKKKTILTYILFLGIAILIVSFKIGIFKYESIAIISNSMSPTFTRGDLVIYEKEASITNQDIIIYQSDDKIIVHRIISQNNNYYITKGDANNSPDSSKVSKEDIKGVYKFHLKYLGFPAIWLKEFLDKEAS